MARAAAAAPVQKHSEKANIILMIRTMQARMVEGSNSIRMVRKTSERLIFMGKLQTFPLTTNIPVNRELLYSLETAFF